MKKNIATLPPFTVEKVVSTLSQTIDWGLKDLNIPETWKITKGAGITVLVIDTGCPATVRNKKFLVHPDLKDNVDIDKCKSFIPSEGIEDLQGHSSHCAGIIGASNNDIGCVGYAPECTIVTYKGLDRNGSGSMDQITKALEYAASTLKPDVISMSLGSTIPFTRMEKVIKKLRKMNIPIIAAGGNGGSFEGVNWPGRYEDTITIGAYDVNKSIADFSAVGDTIDFAFPGVDIYSTYLNGSYAKMSGTSMATPAAAGVIALLLAKHRKQEAETGKNDCITVDQIKEHLTKYSIDLGKTGKDSQWGNGIIDVSKMISESNTYTPVITAEPVITTPALEIIEPGFSGTIGNFRPSLDDNGTQKYNSGIFWYRIPLFDYTSVAEKLVFTTKSLVQYQLDNNFSTDGGSIPPALRLLPFAHLDPFNFTRSYLYHDCAYQFGGLYIKYPGETTFKFRLMTRKEANILLSETLLYDNATKYDKCIISAGLGIGSAMVWDKNKKPKLQREQRKINKITVHDRNGNIIEMN